MRWTSDLDTGALYFQLRDGEPASQVEIAPGAVVDLDNNGRPLGIELYDPAGRGPAIAWADQEPTIDGMTTNAIMLIITTYMASMPGGPRRIPEPPTTATSPGQIGELVPA